MPKDSQLRSWNNDGMDPHWKPEPSPKITIIKNIESLFYTLAGISGHFDKYSEEDLAKLDTDNMVVRLTFTSKQILEIREIIKAAL